MLFRHSEFLLISQKNINYRFEGRPWDILRSNKRIISSWIWKNIVSLMPFSKILLTFDKRCLLDVLLENLFDSLNFCNCDHFQLLHIQCEFFILRYWNISRNTLRTKKNVHNKNFFFVACVSQRYKKKRDVTGMAQLFNAFCNVTVASMRQSTLL